MTERNWIVPNPAQDRIRVLLEGFSELRSVRAVSTNGTAVRALRVLGYEDGVLTCDVSTLPTGLWFMDIQGKETRQILKLAIAR
jgi:hypothetical protein